MFCGKRADSNEDALPRWIAKLIGPKPGERSYHEVRDKYFETNVFEVKVKRVCVTCNTGWMADLERHMQRLLPPMLFGESTEIVGREDMRLIAAWVFKTAITLGYAKAKGGMEVPLEHCEYLRNYQRPPQTVSIWTGIYSSDPSEARYRRVWQRSKAGIDPRQPYLITFLIGQAVFQVFGHLGGDRLELRPSPAGWLVQIFPLPDEGWQWPPPRVFDTKALEALQSAMGDPSTVDG